MKTPVNVEDFRALARKRLPRMVFDYLDGGAEDERGLRHNCEAFEHIRFQPKRLVNVSKRQVSTTLFGKSIQAPILVGPTGLNGVFWPEGDLELARSAARFGIPFVLSTASSMSIEEVADRAGGDLWFQLYVVHRKLAEQLVKRALSAGYSTLVLTTDVTVNGKRERDIRNGFSVPVRHTFRTVIDGLAHPRWCLDLLRNGMPQLANFASSDASDTEVQAALMSRQMDATFAWNDLIWLRSIWPHRLLVKGISRLDDALKCIGLGADGVILSNHGARQLDSAISPMSVLPETARVVSAPVLVDGGIRRGSDVVKAIALGASAVLLGRSTLYGLAARGGQGVDAVLEIMKDEIDRTLAQLGCPSIADLSTDFVASPEKLSGCSNAPTQQECVL